MELIRRTVLVLCVALLLPGCLNWRGPHHPAAGAELVAVGSAIEAWTAAGREEPAGPRCEPLSRVEVVIVAPYPEGRSPCVYIEEDVRLYGAACMRVVQPHVGAPATLAIYLDESLDERGRQNGIAHEVLHFARSCVMRDVDRLHEDTELWGGILSDAHRRLAQ